MSHFVIKSGFYRFWIIVIICTIVSACDRGGNKQEDKQKDWNEKIIADLFKKPVTDFDLVLNSEVTNLQQLQEASESIYMPADTIVDAVSKLQNIKVEQEQQHIVRLSYEILRHNYSSYAYTDRVYKNTDTAYLFIPGTGENESGKIFYSNQEDYHCCLRTELSRKNVAFYVYVKPNTDFLAIHHKGKILDGNIALYPQLISMGGSYSTRYLVDAIALVKYLKSVYRKVVIIGLSQGGAAALLVALQAEPDVAIVSSGYSILNAGPVYIANIEQIVIPGFLSRYTPEYIRKTIQQQSTQYLFSYGQAENGIYGYEAAEKVTENFMKNVENASFYYHSKGHVYPEKGITDYLQSKGL